MYHIVPQSRYPVQASYTIFYTPSMTGSHASIANVPSFWIYSLLTCPCRQPAARSLGAIDQRSTAIIICMSRYVKHGIRTDHGYPHNSQRIRSGPIGLVDFSAFSFASLTPRICPRPPVPPPPETCNLNFESRPPRPSPSLKSEPWIMTQNSLSRIMLRYGCSHPRPCKAYRSLAYTYSSPS
ncbi:hypothetical protein CPAR01_09178 [Colletotrichum paranaense]|uniref:Uncharacterized protein n=1 Tax=Colletotrichum paranaense TaxID=1914294 RepID=A0ABQ9SGQ0_9PEZI|nr:uncharacterized protein CPAR01_09178 [Colletotrichum paranaense]KAK1535636.1 hypothetical protein CPAR01_09178 [Colletotrichum paranaense]